MTTQPSSETMTLESLHDWHKGHQRAASNSGRWEDMLFHERAANAIDAHLSAERREREGYRLPSEWKLETGEADGEKWISLRTGNNFIRYWPTDGMFYWFLSELLIAAAHDGESI